jgi:hypothetical protein
MKQMGRVLPICALAALLASGTAHASDAVMGSVTIPAGQPEPIVVENGTTQSQGTYAIGTIQLLYTVEAMEFPVGDFAVFNLGLAIQASTKGQPTVYPVNVLSLNQTGSSSLVLDPATDSFSVGSAAWTTETPVTVRIPAGVPNDDGTTLVGNLQIVAPGGSHLDTVTTVQVKIKLVHPTACLKLYDFVTDVDLTTVYSDIQVNVNRRGNVTSTNPGQLSNNVLVVNTCASPETFDARVVLDPYFSTNPSNNPGNAVFTFFSSSEVDPDTALAASWSTGAGQGQNLCLPGVTLPAHSSWLAAVKMSFNAGISSSSLASPGTFAFSGTLLDPATTGCSGAVNGAVTPANPATATVGYTVK